MLVPAGFDAMSNKALFEGLHCSSHHSDGIAYESEEGAGSLRVPTSCGAARLVGSAGVTTEHSDLVGTRTFENELTDHKAEVATV